MHRLPIQKGFHGFVGCQDADVKAEEIIEASLYDVPTWMLLMKHYHTIRQNIITYYLVRCIGFKKKQQPNDLLFYSDALRKTKCESIETIGKRCLLLAGQLPHERRVPTEDYVFR